MIRNKEILLALFLSVLVGQSIATTLIPNVETTSEFSMQGPPKTTGDTLKFNIWSLDTSNYFFYPFGEYSRENDLKKALLKEQGKWQHSKKNGLTFSSKNGDTVKFIFKERSQIEKYEIVTAKLVTPIRFHRKGIRIGMEINQFYQVFFKKYPALWGAFGVIEMETGAYISNEYKGNSSIRHLYKFEKAHLKEIKIEATR